MADNPDELSAPSASDTEPAGDDAPTAMDVLVERWWEQYFPGSRVAYYHEAWTVCVVAKEALKQLLNRNRSA